MTVSEKIKYYENLLAKGVLVINTKMIIKDLKEIEEETQDNIKYILDHSAFSTEYVFADILLKHHWGQLDLDEAIELMYDRMVEELEEVFEELKKENK